MLDREHEQENMTNNTYAPLFTDGSTVPVRIVRLVDFPRRELEDLFDRTILVVGVGIEAG